MKELKQAIQAIEHGLLKGTGSKDRPEKKMDLYRRMAYYKVPGVSAAFVARDELAWTGTYGVAEAGGGKPVTAETIFQAASISKPLTALLVLHLVETGLLSLDTDVNDYLRFWKVPRNKYTREHPVSLRGLLSHTAGVNISGYRGYAAGEPLPALQQVLNGEAPANSKPVRVVQTPGEAFKYSGGGYVIVQQVLEDVSGSPLVALAKEIIFDKLGMSNSTFEPGLPDVFLPQAASAHLKSGEVLPGRWFTYPEQGPAALWSTSTDLARLISEVLKSLKNESNLVLSAEMTRRMLVPQMDIGGLGFNIVIQDGLTRFGHAGWNEGFHSLLLGCPETGQGVVFMCNGENGKNLRREVARGLAEVVKWSWW